MAKPNKKEVASEPGVEQSTSGEWAQPGQGAIKRVALGLYKSRLARVQPWGLNPMELLEDGTAVDSRSVMFFACSSDLWKPLTVAFGKCDGMVPGKYKKARVFAFESASAYVWCHNETGDRGTSWFMASKDSVPKDAASGFYAYAKLDKAQRAEINDFFQTIMVACALAHEPTMEELADYPPVKALLEARELRAEVSSAKLSEKKRPKGL
jgi:hypothetical protein